MKKKKILVALFRIPYPAIDGTRYKILNNVVSGIMKDFDVEFFIINIKRYDQSDIDYLQKHFGKVHLFQNSKISFVINAIPSIIKNIPLQAQAFHFSDAQKWLDGHIDEYAGVYIHEIRMTEFFINYTDIQKQKFLVDFNDAISMNYNAGVKKLNFFKKMFYKWEGRKVAHYESMVLSNFSHFNIVSEIDKEYLLNAKTYTGSTDIDFSVINHGVHITDNVAICDKDEVFFMGSLDYEPNHDAVEYFLENIWSKFIKTNNTTKFIVIGSGKIPEKWKHFPRVLFLGFVPDIFEVVKGCKALVAPIRFAGGTPSKIIETMGYGIPVITTPQAIAGINGVVSDMHLIAIEETDHARWVSILESILNNSSYRLNIAYNARKIILEKYSIEAAQKAFYDRFHKITN